MLLELQPSWAPVSLGFYGELSMIYKIALQQSEEGFSVSVPGLPGCGSQGTTEQEAIENIKDAIREYLAVVDEQLRGENIREIEVSV
jgi:predicted RNase H-like HicB family nuclease